MQFLGVAVLAVSYRVGVAFAEPSPAKSLTGPGSAEEITQLVRSLGDPSFAERTFASRRLCVIGADVVEPLRAAMTADDAEVVLRARQLLEVFEQLQFSGTEVSLQFSKSVADWNEAVDLTVTFHNRSRHPARVPFDVETGARASVTDEARQVADMLDLAEWVKVRSAEGRELELRLDDLGGDPAIVEVLEDRLKGGAGGLVPPRQQAVVVVREFNRGWARFPLLDPGEYKAVLDYLPEWTDPVLAEIRAGRVVSNEASITIRRGAPATVSRGGPQMEIVVERTGDAFIARLMNGSDQVMQVNTNFGPVPPFAEGRWVVESEGGRSEIPTARLVSPSWADFKAARIVNVEPGEAAELARIAVAELPRVPGIGPKPAAGRTTVSFGYANLWDRKWQERQRGVLHDDETVPEVLREAPPRRLVTARSTSNRLPLE